jgi:hypothetical protein
MVFKTGLYFIITIAAGILLLGIFFLMGLARFFARLCYYPLVMMFFKRRV